ncbi:MAG: serine/threonine-protein kinase [Gemmataceae bacterium]
MTDESIFAAARAIADPAERAAYLDHACAGDAALRREVDELLAADGRTGQFLDAPPSVPVWQPGPYRPPESVGTAGAVIAGRYKLLQKLGEGGMGTVWMAEQTAPVKRLAALKLVKPGMDSGEVIARFEAERQALALMDHPNIAKVLDGGTTADGRPFFVMELVKGLPLTAYCDERLLTVRQRLELFAQVCAAVQHAHQKGIIHRDLKPTNVLVTEHDGTPVPKVIDFGLAKALHAAHALTERTLYTAFGAVVGTPLYMAPEQVATNALDVDTRTDVYALGVILYELLTGTTPLERARLAKAAWDEVRRLIREEEPPKPSTRLSSSDALPSVAALRQAEPAALGKLVRGELDWIALKALEKDRNRRYESATALSRDVQRYLADEPVEACPPTAAYRLRKFARKHRGPLSAAATLAVVLLAATGVSLWQADVARRSEAAAVAARNDLATANDGLEGTLARSLCRPLQISGNYTLSEPESEAMWELAQGQQRLGDRFLTEATRLPLSAAQLRARAEPAMIAAVGLDPERRARALRLVANHLGDRQLNLSQRADLALVGLELIDPTAELNAMIVETLRATLTKEPGLSQIVGRRLLSRDDRLLPADAARFFAEAIPIERDLIASKEWAVGLAAAADRLPPEEATRLCRGAARLFSDSLAKATGQSPQWPLAQGLANMTTHLPPDYAARIVSDAFAKVSEQGARRSLVIGAVAIAGRLPPGEAGRLLTDILATEADGPSRLDLAQGLVQFADGLAPEDGTSLLATVLAKETTPSVRKRLAEGLARQAARLPSDDTARACGDAARRLADALARETDPYSRQSLAEGLGYLAQRLPPEVAAPMCGTAGRLLLEGLANETNVRRRPVLAAGLVRFADHLPPHEAVRVCGESTERLAHALANEADKYNRRSLAAGLAQVVVRLPPEEAVRLLVDALGRDDDPHVLGALARGLAQVADRLPAERAALLCGKAARRLSNAFSRESDDNALWDLVQGMTAIAGHLVTADVERLCSLASAKTWGTGYWPEQGGAVAGLLTWLPSADAHRRSRELARIIAADPRALDDAGTGETFGWIVLDQLLTDNAPSLVQRRAASALAHFGPAAAGPLAALPALPAAAEPLPCRLTTQELVELLKMPTCYGEARKVVLKHLGNRYGRRFADHWAFVRYATDHHLGLDFTTPPKRPTP